MKDRWKQIFRFKNLNPYQKKYFKGIIQGFIGTIIFVFIINLLWDNRFWMTQKEKDFKDLKDSISELVCIQIESGWCFCLPKGQSNPHCSTLVGKVRLYEWKELFPDPPRKVYVKSTEQINEVLK